MNVLEFVYFTTSQKPTYSNFHFTLLVLIKYNLFLFRISVLSDIGLNLITFREQGSENVESSCQFHEDSLATNLWNLHVRLQGRSFWIYKWMQWIMVEALNAIPFLPSTPFTNNYWVLFKILILTVSKHD